MKRAMGLAAITAALLVWGLPLVAAQTTDLSLQEATQVRADATLEAHQDQANRDVARILINASSTSRGDTHAHANVGWGDTPRYEAASSEPRIPLLGQDEAATAGWMAAGAGSLMGLGLAAYYWASIKVWLAGTLLAPLFSRIDKDKILDNEARNRVHDAIEHNPGVTIKELTGICGIGWGTAVYHLKRLEDEKLVVSQRHRQFRRYFKNGGGIVNGEKRAFSELKSDTGKALAEAVLKNPGSVQKELCAKVGISAPLAHKYLARLERASLIRREREWKFVKYFPTDRLGTMVQQPQLVVA